MCSVISTQAAVAANVEPEQPSVVTAAAHNHISAMRIISASSTPTAHYVCSCRTTDSCVPSTCHGALYARREEEEAKIQQTTTAQEARLKYLQWTVLIDSSRGNHMLGTCDTTTSHLQRQPSTKPQHTLYQVYGTQQYTTPHTQKARGVHLDVDHHKDLKRVNKLNINASVDFVSG